MIKIIYKGKIPSLNATYKTGKGRFYMSSKVKDFKKQIELLSIKHKDSLPTGELCLSVIEYNSSFYTKKGLLSKTKGDADRYLKSLMDGLCKGLGIDDYLITKIFAQQVPSKEVDALEITLSESHTELRDLK